MPQLFDLTPDNPLMLASAELLLLSFAEMAPSWVTSVDEARAELLEVFDNEQAFVRVLCEGDAVIGLVGGFHSYERVWELHPLAVHPAHQGRGYGRLLVEVCEAMIRERGGLVVMLGTDDEAGWTSLYGQDLYPDVLGMAQAMRNTGRHPFSFYERLGYAVTGIIPDANGFGKPDIIMCKRLLPWGEYP